MTERFSLYDGSHPVLNCSRMGPVLLCDDCTKGQAPQTAQAGYKTGNIRQFFTGMAMGFQTVFFYNEDSK